MHWISKVVVACSFAVLAVLTGLSASSAYAQQPKTILAVVVAKNSPVKGLTIFELKRLFTGETETGGTELRLIPIASPPRSAERVAFDEAVLGMTADQAASFWIDRKIRGQSGAPKAIDSSDLLQRVVNRLDGAVGYVRVSELRSDVKVIPVDGKFPGDAGYQVAY